MEDCVEGALGLPPPLHWDIPFLQVSCLSTDRFHGFHVLSLRYGLIGDIDPETNDVPEKQKSFEKVKELYVSLSEMKELKQPGCSLVQEQSSNAADLPPRVLRLPGGEAVVGTVHQAALA